MSDTGDKGYTWESIGTRQTTSVLPDGSVGQVVEVTFKMSTGDVGKVVVPLAGMTAASVRAAIDAHAAELYAVRTLTG